VKNKTHASVYHTFALSLLTLAVFLVYSLSENTSSLRTVFQGSLYINILLLTAILLPLSFIRLKKLDLRIPPVFVMIFLNFVIITAVFFADSGVYRSRFVQVMDFVFILFALQYLLQLMKKIIVNLLWLTNE
jgi:hypothetical protein